MRIRNIEEVIRVSSWIALMFALIGFHCLSRRVGIKGWFNGIGVGCGTIAGLGDGSGGTVSRVSLVVVLLSATLFSRLLASGLIPSTIDSIDGTGDLGLVFGNPDPVCIMVLGSTPCGSGVAMALSLGVLLSGVEDTSGSAKLTLFA